MSTACDRFGADLAALAMQAPDVTTVPATQAHIDGCPACAATLAELRATVGVLDLADPDRVSQPSRAPAGLRGHVLAMVERDQLRARRRTLVTRTVLTAAAAAVVVMAGWGVTTVRGPDPEVVVLHSGSSNSTELTARAALTPRAWGTAVDLVVDRSEPGTTYRVWLTDAEGRRTPAGTFRGADRSLRMNLAVAVSAADASSIGISTDDADRLVLARLSGG